MKPTAPHGYNLGVFAYRHPAGLGAVGRVLDGLGRVLPDEYPLALRRRNATPIAINKPGAFLPDLIAKPLASRGAVGLEYAIDAEYATGDDGSFTVEFETRHASLTLAAWARVGRIPSSINIDWETAEALPPLGRLAELLRVLAEAFGADYGRVSDHGTLFSAEIDDRRFTVDVSVVPEALHWITWLDAERVSAIGSERLKRLRPPVGVTSFPDGSALLVLQPQPFEFSRDSGTRRSAEEAFGLAALHQAFPAQPF